MNQGGTPLSIQHVSGAKAAPESPRDETDYDHRHFVNLAATALLLGVGCAIVWTVLAIDRYEANQRCLASGRIDCVRIAEPTRAIRPMELHPKP